MTEINWQNEPDLDEIRRLHAMLSTNPEEALAGLTKLARRGSVASMLYLADGYMGKHFDKDLSKALHWFVEADKTGYPVATHWIGHVYLEQQRFAEAIEAFSRSSKAGNLSSLYTLATLHRDGKGTMKDAEITRVLFEQATAQGHLYATRDLARMYTLGTYGLKYFSRGIYLFTLLIFRLLSFLVRSARGHDLDERVQG